MGALKIFSVSLILFFAVFIDVSFKHFLEEGARQNARYILDNTKNCTNELLGKTTNADNNAIENALKTCSGKARTTPTGDSFAFDSKTLDFVFDPSIDCYVEGGKKMTVESECSLHSNKVMCEDAISVLTRGYDSDSHTKLSWSFNGSIEYLEFVVLPEEYFGYDGVQRGSNKKPHQIILAQGIQEKELLDKYLIFRIILTVSSVVIMMFTLVLIRCSEGSKNE